MYLVGSVLRLMTPFMPNFLSFIPTTLWERNKHPRRICRILISESVILACQYRGKWPDDWILNTRRALKMSNNAFQRHFLGQVLHLNQYSKHFFWKFRAHIVRGILFENENLIDMTRKRPKMVKKQSKVKFSVQGLGGVFLIAKKGSLLSWSTFFWVGHRFQCRLRRRLRLEPWDGRRKRRLRRNYVCSPEYSQSII